MSLIQITNLTFAYDGSYDNVFENVSFAIDTDWRLGFIGRNGRGKTTFLQLLLHRYEYQGSIAAQVSFDYFPYRIEDTETMPYLLLEELAPEAELWQFCRELNLLEVDEEVLYRPFQSLSNGEQTKVLLALLFLRPERFLLIDEPTNHLDRHAREVVGEYLRKKKGFILVSHDRDFLNRAIDHVLSINRADITVQKGDFDTWEENRRLADAFEQSQNQKLKKEIRRLSQSAVEKAQWSGTAERRKIGFNPAETEKSMGRRAYQGAKSKKMMSRAKAIQNRTQSAVEEKQTLLKNIEYTDDLKLTPLKHHSKTLVSFVDVSLCYGDKTVLDGLSFSVAAGERVALVGRNGCGKTTVLKLLLQRLSPTKGQVTLASGLTLSYVSQDTTHLQGSLPSFALEHGLDLSLFQSVLRKMGFDRVQFEKSIEQFSGGQKKKVLLAQSLCTPAHLYLWDEPLNYIDVISRMQLEELLLAFQPTMLFVEHDARFTETIATKTVSL